MRGRANEVVVRFESPAQGGVKLVKTYTLQRGSYAIPVKRNIKVHREDSGSISKYGERAYPDTAPWANANDAGVYAGFTVPLFAVAGFLLLGALTIAWLGDPGADAGEARAARK